MATYYFKVIGRPPVTGTPVGSRTEKEKHLTSLPYSKHNPAF